MTKSVNLIVSVALIAFFSIAIWSFYVWLKPDPKPEVEDDGTVVSKVIDVKLEDLKDLRILRLRGTVQAGACVTWWKVLHPCRVFKAPAEASYFIDASRVKLGDFRWDDKSHTLWVTIPSVRVDAWNVDTSRMILDETDGVFIPRAAMTELQRRSSVRAREALHAEAEKPDNLRRAQENGRRAMESLFHQPLRAAGIGADVRVSYANERRDDGQRWDVSRSLDQILHKVQAR